MLLRIPTSQVELGMYVDRLEGSWFDHPFWRASFLLTDPADLQKLRRSAIPSVVIDDSKGRGVAAATAPTASPAMDAGLASPDDRPSRRRPLTRINLRRNRPKPTPVDNRPCSQSEELERAADIVNRAKEAVRQVFGEVRFGRAVEMSVLAPLVEEIAGSVARNPYALIGIARIKDRDEYTYVHSVAVAALMVNLAQHLALDESLIHEIGMAGLMHDIGKMLVPEDLLKKEGTLSDAEYAQVKHHAERGYQLLLEHGAPELVLDVCRHHHERLDGSGYPYGLRGDQISLYARMAAICDVYDAVTSNRPYKRGWHPADTLAKMQRTPGHFDQRILDTFERSIGIYPVGTLIRLRSNRLAVVVEECPDDLTRPILRTFYCASNHHRLPIKTLQLSAVDDRIVSPEKPEAWGFTAWERLRESIMSPALATPDPAANLSEPRRSAA